MLAIRTAPTPKKGTPFVFFLFEKEVFEKHPLFQFLTPSEKSYLRNIKKSVSGKEREVRVVVTPGVERKVIIVGLGDPVAFNTKKAGLATRAAVQTARKENLQRFAFYCGFIETPETTREFYEVVAANAVMANFEFVKYKTAPPEGFVFLNEIQGICRAPSNRDVAEGFRRGVIIGEETNACRELSNTPGGDMTPQILADHAKAVAKASGVKVEILNEENMKSLEMGGVLGVAKGSDAPPRFIVLEYMNGPKEEAPIVFVGKGVTFDTGGLNLKGSEHIYEMHMDMSGGAAVVHAVVAAARLRVKKNIVALVPAVENMPSGSSYRPGDLLRTMSGKTIEILNTDAEGRVILADALEYAKRYNPALVVDVATLTGAAQVALGMRYSALFATNKALEEKFRALGEATGDAVWPLPLSTDYEEEIRGTFGDWANTGKKGMGGGAITAAVFLWQFTKNVLKNGKTSQAYPWVHLDIAPRMTTIEGEFLAKGAAGAPVRLLVRLLET